MAKLMRLSSGKLLSHGIRIDIWQYRIYRDTGDESIVWFRSIVFTAIIELVNDIFMFTVGIMLIQLSAGKKSKLEPKELLSPGMIGVLIGLILFLADFRLPEMLGGSVEMIGNATTPLAMFVIGYQLGSMKVRTLLGEWQVYVVIFFKLAVIPVLALVFVKILAEEFSLMEKVIVLCFAMPAASASVLFSRQYMGKRILQRK